MKKETTIKYLNNAQIKKLFKVMKNYSQEMKHTTERDYRIAVRNEALFHVMYYCALRVSETIKIEVQSFNIERNEIYCNRIKNGINNTLRIVDPYVTKIIKKHILINKPQKYLFEISRATADNWIKFYCNLSKIPTELAHCHTLRHSRAIYLAECGCDLKELQYWLGHSDINNTLIYFQFTSKQKDYLYKKLRKEIY